MRTATALPLCAISDDEIRLRLHRDSGLLAIVWADSGGGRLTDPAKGLVQPPSQRKRIVGRYATPLRPQVGGVSNSIRFPA